MPLQQDPSAELYDRYFALANRKVTVNMKNGASYQGVFIGFFHGEENDRYAILRWHLLPEGEHAPLGIGAGGERKGVYVRSAQIASVVLHGDHSIIHFG